MKYCPKCGKPNKDDANFCEGCGHSFNVNPTSKTNNMNINPTFDPNNKPSSMGLVSMILGIIAIASLVICCCIPIIAIIVGPIAIILGIIFLVKNKNMPKNQAVLGIVLGSIALVIGIMLFVGILTIDPEAIKQAAIDECTRDPNSPECQGFKQLFPHWFE